MEQSNKTGQFVKITEEMAALYDKKNKAYGNSFAEAISTYGEFWKVSASTQITHKHNRLVSLVTNPKVDDLGESLEDTLLDLANYSIMFLMELRAKKEQKTETDSLMDRDSMNTTIIG